MNKIKNYLIHLLGGVTEEQCDRRVIYRSKMSRFDVIRHIKLKMDGCYGMPADEWCKSVYEYTCEQHEKMQKDLEEYVNSSKNTAAGED